MSEIADLFERRPPKHIAFWVDDVPAAVRRWSTVYGAGPFFDVSSTAPDGRFRGQSVRFSEDAAYGRFGSVSVDLMRFRFHEPAAELRRQLRCDVPNTISHVAYFAADPVAASARLEARGYPKFFEMGLGGEVSTFWHDTWVDFGHCIEITGETEPLRRFQAAVDRVTADWDGHRPLRVELPVEVEGEMGPYLARHPEWAGVHEV